MSTITADGLFLWKPELRSMGMVEQRKSDRVDERDVCRTRVVLKLPTMDIVMVISSRKDLSSTCLVPSGRAPTLPWGSIRGKRIAILIATISSLDIVVCENYS